MISVCIPTYNGEKYIIPQILSILKQLKMEDELIISDDGSSDKTLDLIRSLNDNRIKILKNTNRKIIEKYKFMHTTRNLENALSHAKGQYIFLADQDDIWANNKVEVSLKYLQTSSLVLSDCNIIDDKDELIEESYFKINHSALGIGKNLIKNSYLGCCMAFKSSLLAKVLPISKYNVPHDIWIGLLAEKFGSVSLVKEKLVKYRRHDSNVSPSGGNSSNTMLFRIKYRLEFLIAYFSRIIQYKP